MLMLRRRKSEATRARTPGLSWDEGYEGVEHECLKEQRVVSKEYRKATTKG